MRPPPRSRPNRLRHLEHLVLGTSYPAIARHVKVLIGAEALCGRAIVSAGATVVDVLRRLLRDFKIRIDPQPAHDGYAAWRAGAHDDLVLAAAAAAWDADPLEATRARCACDGIPRGKHGL